MIWQHKQVARHLSLQNKSFFLKTLVEGTAPTSCADLSLHATKTTN
jgi:hypothetical protein